MKTLFVRSLLLVLLAVTQFSCTSKSNQTMEDEPNWFSAYDFFSTKDYYQFFKNEMAQFCTREGDSISAAMADFYHKRGDEPYWTYSGFQEQHIETLTHCLSNSYEQHGISNEHFDFPKIQSIIDDVKSIAITEETALYQQLFELEVTLNQALMKYSAALQFGLTHPTEVNGGKWLHQTSAPDSLFWTRCLQSTDSLTQFLESVQPRDSEYVALQAELAKYLAISGSHFMEIPHFAVDSGKRHDAVKLVARRLSLTGELPAETPISDTLNASLLRALRTFANNNAIPMEKTLNDELIDALNRKPQHYVDKLVVNLERRRWHVLPQKEHDYIAVNLADQSLRAVSADTTALRMRICCGKSKKTDNGVAAKSESPMLYSYINYVVLNPEWRVPVSILQDEYYWKFLKNCAGTMAKEHLHLIDLKTNKEVDATAIDWKKVPRKNIPYRLIQSSGVYNSLGKIKFNIPNSESVYLHDTNNKSAFKRRKRTLSHGCVRVEKPVELALLLFEMNDYDSLAIERALIILGNEPTTEEGEEFLKEREEKEAEYYEKLSDEDKVYYRALRPTSIILKKKMPVYIEYFTCFRSESGEMQFRDDIYFKEAAILERVARSAPPQ